MPFRKETWDHEGARWAYIGIVIAAAISMAVLFVLILGDKRDITREASIRATQIQQQRYDATFQNCLDTNRRHVDALRKLQHIFHNYIKTHPSKAAQVKASEDSNALLIDALVPKRNCTVVAKSAVHPLVNPTGR